MNYRNTSFKADLPSSTARWSVELSQHRRNVPGDIAKFHMNLVMLDYSKADIAFMVDTIQEDAKAWEADGRLDFANAGQVESFLSVRCIHDENLGQITVSPRARRRHVLRRKARDIFGRLASFIGSDWPFTRALREYNPDLTRHWPEPGEDGYFTCLEASTSSYWRLKDARSRRAERGHTSCADETSETTRRERRDALKLLRIKLALASQAEADLLDVPQEVVLHCAIVDGFDNHAYDALSSLYRLWLEYSAPELGAAYQASSLVAYWLKRRRMPSPGISGVVPDELVEDMAAIRAFCDWTNMPKLSAFARVFQACDGDFVLPEDVVEDADQLQAYLDDTEIWFRIHVAGEAEPVDIDF